jgi:predicted nucleic acid-binding protein
VIPRPAATSRSTDVARGQIAAITAVNDLVLVTRNLRDFAGFAGLKLESWFTA